MMSSGNGQSDGPDSCECDIYLFLCLFAISRAAPAAYEGSQARGPIGAVAASLRQQLGI